MTASHSGAYRDIAEIKLSYPVLEVVERAGVSLKRSGSHRWQGLCPFHADRTPSFFVDVERQRFVCFGCKARGDVIDFVRLHEQLSTVGEACNWLTGTPAPTASTQSRPPAPPGQRERRWDRLTLEQQLVLNAAGALYRDALWRNRVARAYLADRGLPDWVVRACGLGFADGRSLESHLRKHGGLRIAEDLGLLRRPEAGEGGRMLRERFAGRVVIPELRGGQPIWFLGRHPTYREARVKYLGLPGEKPLLGFERAAGRREVYLVEGAFDWLTAVSWHLPAFSTCAPISRLIGLVGWPGRVSSLASWTAIALGARLPNGSGWRWVGGGSQCCYPRVATSTILGASQVVELCSFGWWRLPDIDQVWLRKGLIVMAEQFRRRCVRGQREFCRLRGGVLRLGGYLGLDTRGVVRLGEAISGERWRRCRSVDLERVAAEFAELADRMVVSPQRTNTEPVQLAEFVRTSR